MTDTEKSGSTGEDPVETGLVRYAESTKAIETTVDVLPENVVDTRLVISLVGNVNTGKSSLINAMLGMNVADVKPYAGHTRHVALYPFPGMPNVRISDTPGLEDVRDEVSRRAEDFVAREADLVLHLFNASVGITHTEKEAHEAIGRLNRPLLPVLNKMDLLDAADRTVVLDDVQGKLGKRTVLPVSAKTGEGVEALTVAVSKILEGSNKHLVFARIARCKDPLVDNLILKGAAAAFALGVTPIPGPDTIPLTILQATMCGKIAAMYGHGPDRKDIAVLLTEIAAGAMGKAVFRTLLKTLGWAGGPYAEAVAAGIAGVTAGSMTYGIGRAAKAWYQSGMTLPADRLQQLYETGVNAYRKLRTDGQVK